MEWEYILRLIAAGVFGGIIGLNREYRAKEAGYRTHFLVSVGSALLMIVSQYAFIDLAQEEGYSVDPGRIAAQVVSGIGFLGAGTIILHKHFVRGLTTAAGIWTTAGIGLAAGAGMYIISIIATILTLIGLEVLGMIFKQVGRRNSAVVFSTSKPEEIKQTIDLLIRHRYLIISYEMTETNTEQLIVTVLLKAPKEYGEGELLSLLHKNPNIMIINVE